MTNDLYFEITDPRNFVRIEPKRLTYPDSETEFDRNWIETSVSIKAGKFSGQYETQFMTVDFEQFKQQLSSLSSDLNGTAYFHSLEGQLELKISGDGLGHFDVDAIAIDEAQAEAATLRFSIKFDQTSLGELMRQLDAITQKFRITGTCFKG